MDLKIDQTIEFDGDTWTIVGLGAAREDGARIVHAASQTRFLPQRNGKNPVQATGWFTKDGELEQANW